MNEGDRTARVQEYLEEVSKQFNSGYAREHSYRPAIERLMMSFNKVHAVNEPKHSDFGAPDLVFLSDNNTDLILGYAEAKDIGVSLDKTEKTEQMQRYHGYANLFLTDYLEFRFFRNGEKYETISLGQIKDKQLHLTPENGGRLIRELEAFLEQTPEKIRSGKRLAQIMGGKARRIRDNVVEKLTNNQLDSSELDKIYEMMKQMLVHDLEPKTFGDMYAQTLVYGLFVARYGDNTPANFTRSEARDLVPKSNPFLRHFFDHIVGPSFDARLAYIVDELCEIFSVSDVASIVHKHLRIQDATIDAKDPIIHFYEDFLQEYDSTERKKMGAYYTPVPVVKYIVSQVDKILKEELSIVRGLASTDTVDYWIETGQDHRTDKRYKAQTGYSVPLPRVQILDPAVGTATFLNEAIKYIHKSFKGQEGRWESYVNDNLVKRLYGFELMMAPYTIAHLKLGMTLKETGVDNLSDRLGVYLTNTLEEGVLQKPDLFSFGLAEAVSQESRLAAQVKSERPVTVVIGNPPYSVESSNKTKYAESLVDKYRVEPGGSQKLQERNSKMIGDDYVKFIAFAENIITKNGTGVVAMITNNGYLENPTFRGMRWHLRRTFDKIYILDLHGNSNKKETTPDGSKDENVFDIQQGVGIILAVKTSDSTNPADVYHAELYGSRAMKFRALNDASPDFQKIDPDEKNIMFTPFSTEGQSEYDQGVELDELFIVKAAGIKTSSDGTSIAFSKLELQKQIENSNEIESFDEAKVKDILYRPFDIRNIYYDPKIVKRDRYQQIKHTLHDNISILSGRFSKNGVISQFFVTNLLSEMKTAESTTGSYQFQLYLYHDDGTRTSNFNSNELKKLTIHLSAKPAPEDVIDYIYASLYSPSYRNTYKEFLKTDFPRIPIPTQSEFNRLVPLGRELRELHLMKSPVIDQYITTFPEVGDNGVEKLDYEDEKVWINSVQYFGKVPERVWNYYIGGYQPAQKWLKDRKGRTLSDDELEQYQKIIKILSETDRIMKEIG